MLSLNFLNKGRLLLVACVICCSGCAAHTQLTTAVPSVLAERPRIAVLPVYNVSGQRAPLKEMHQALMQGMVNLGAVVPNYTDLDRFMARHRIRYIGGIDTFTSQAFKEELGIDAVLITTLEQYV